MDPLRILDAFCASCDEITPHAVMDLDPSACYCNECGTAQVLTVPAAGPGRSVGRAGAIGAPAPTRRPTGEKRPKRRPRPAPGGAPQAWHSVALAAEAIVAVTDQNDVRALAKEILTAAQMATSADRLAPHCHWG